MPTRTSIEINLLVFANKGAKLYKNGKLYFSFTEEIEENKNTAARISLKTYADYMSVQSDTTTNNIIIMNNNGFAIDVKRTVGSTNYWSFIAAEDGKLIKVNQSDKIMVYKAAASKQKVTNPEQGRNLDTKTKIRYSIYADKGIDIYKDNRPIYSFSSKTDIRVYFDAGGCEDADDYIIAERDIKIEIQNDNDFEIKVFAKRTIDGNIVCSQTDLIKSKEKKTLSLKAMDRVTLDSSTTDKLPGSRGVGEPTIVTRELPTDKINFELSADSLTKITVHFVLKETGGKLEYVPSQRVLNRTPQAFSFLLSSHDYDYFTIDSEKNIKLKNINVFPIAVRRKNDSKIETIDVASREIKNISFAPKQSQFFLIKTDKESPGTSVPSDNSVFTLNFYGEEGVKLLKNGRPYFSFKKKKLSGVKVQLKDYDYIDIGPDEDFNKDPELNRPTQYTVASSEIRKKKRRLRVKNPNKFFIIVRAEKNNKTYIIRSFSDAFIFFGKEACKLYLLKGKQPPIDQLPESQTGKIILYISFWPLPVDRHITIKRGGEEKKHEGVSQFALRNNEELEFSIKELSTGTKFRTIMCVASGPTNQNIMVSFNETAYVIRPSGVRYIELNLSSQGSKVKVANRVLKTIQIYETTDFRIPFQIVPYILMSTTMEVDILNTSLYELQAGLLVERKENRKRKGRPPGDCDVLTKMLYSTFIPFNAKNKPAAWFFAILFSNEKGLDNVLITMMALKNKFKELAKYLVIEKLLTEFLSIIKSTDYYKSRVSNLMNKNFATFLFELNISDAGFIVCMYRPLRKATLWEDPWRWFSELPAGIG